MSVLLNNNKKGAHAQIILKHLYFILLRLLFKILLNMSNTHVTNSFPVFVSDFFLLKFAILGALCPDTPL